MSSALVDWEQHIIYLSQVQKHELERLEKLKKKSKRKNNEQNKS